MLRLLGRFFAIIGFFVVLIAACGIVFYIHRTHEAAAEPDAVVLVLNFDQPIIEQSDASPFSLAVSNDEPVAMLDILRAIDQAKDDPHVKALVAKFGSEQPSLAQAEEIRDALLRFAESKKPTYAFGSSYGEFGLGNRAYYLASVFQNIWLQPVGTVGLTGLAIESPFGKTALDKIGVKADFMQREEYKSFMDMATRDDFAAPVKANMQALVDDLGSQEMNGIAEGRGIKPEAVQSLMARGPYTDDEALKNGLVTRLAYADELDKELQNSFGQDVKDVDVESYLSLNQGTSFKSSKSKASIALIYGSGMILDRDPGIGIGGDKVMAADKIAGAFEAATENKDIKAIIFRVDSPGGSPSASETIRRAMIHAQQSGKPVFVSMGDMAASGGYWVAMNGDYIAAEPGTLTGSIGVISGKLDIAALLQKLGISIGSVKTADTAGLWSMSGDFTPEQRERVNALLDNSYHTFIQNVSIARKIPMDKMGDVAKGRVWTGAQAQKIGLVDELGGYDVTLAALRKKLNLTPTDEINFEQYPAPETPMEKILKLFKGFGNESAMLGSALGQWQQLHAIIAPFMQDAQMHAPVMARMPVSVGQAVR